MKEKKIIKVVSNSLKEVLIYIVVLYRKYISPLKVRTHCIYTPTCSQYAIEAIEKYGPFKGMLLSIKRILKCNPLSKGGYDPVP